MGSQSTYLAVGRIQRAHGLQGEVLVRVADPRRSLLLGVKRIRLDGEQADRAVRQARTCTQGVLLLLSDLADRTAAERLRGREVSVRRADFPPVAEGEYYFADLVGLDAFDEAGRALGKVRGVWETGGVPVLVIGEGQGELLVPFAEPFLAQIDLPAGRMVVRPPELDSGRGS